MNLKIDTIILKGGKMKNALIIGFAFITICLLSGCGANNYIPLAESYKNQIISSDFVILQTQKEIMAEVKKSNVSMAMGGGLIGALIDASIEKSRATDAEALIQPIRNHLLNYKFEEEIHQELTQVLKNTSWFNMKSLKLVQGENDKQLEQLLSSTSSEAVGIIKPTYALVLKFSALKVRIELSLYPASQSTKNQENQEEKEIIPLYKTIVEHLYSLPNSMQNQEENAKLWAANQGQQIKLGLGESIKESIKKLNSELQNPSKEKKE